MPLDETKPAYHKRMPGQLIGALVIIGFGTVASLFLSYFLWIEYSDAIEHNQEAELWPFWTTLIGALLNIVLVACIIARFNWARLTAVVLSVISGVLVLYTAVLSGAITSAGPGILMNIIVIVLLLNERSAGYTYKGVAPK